MPVIQVNDYLPSWPFKGGHFNTIYASLLRKINIHHYQRERLDTPDGDFIDVDLIMNGNHQLVILCHGLEGSSSSQYIANTSILLSESGWDVLCMNFRGCSGEMNRSIKMYHSGFTEDLHMLVSKYADEYEKIALVGFSLGGNMIMKYLGDGLLPLPNSLKAAIGISVPCDLHAGAVHISRWQNKLYDHKFLVSLRKKIKIKNSQFPEIVDLNYLKKVKTLMDFDNYYTSRLHGFQDASDYYARCNCKQFLKDIKTPALIISALDDPFLPDSSYPFAEAQDNEQLFFMAPKYGGHVGFVTFGKNHYWNEYKILEFINDPNNFL
jgi:predicted alpha/beta-fold hydrolase